MIGGPKNFVLRLLFQLVRADFRDPMADAIVRVTNWLILPLRKLLPPIAKLDTATVVAVLLIAAAIPHAAPAQQTANANAKADVKSSLDVQQLFATTCGWCHSDGGRAKGKGPQLMDSQRSDDFIRTRIKIGKEGAMPAFGSIYSDPDIDAIIKYIRTLKPDNG